jgi:hypothetical protein
MRILGPFCVCALFVASVWTFESFGWADGKSIEGLAWKGVLASGKTLSVRNLNGPVRVAPASGAEAEVRAEVRYGKSDPRSLHFEVKTDERGVHVCSLWPGVTSCDGAAQGRSGEAEDLEVAYEVRLPAGVAFEGGTVNGSIEVRGAAAPVVAASVNGDLRVETSAAPLRADTVNGKIDVRLAALAGDGEIRLSTVNGDIAAQVPARFDAEVSARTVSGSISILGKEYQERVRTTVGKGGRKVSAQNVNGAIAIR